MCFILTYNTHINTAFLPLNIMELDNAIYSTLPNEVINVSHLIGIEPGIGRTTDVSSIVDSIPKKDVGDDLRYKVYSMYEVIERNKPKTKCLRKCLNSKQRRALFNIKKEHFRFTDFHQINLLWHSYFDSVLGEVKNKLDELKLTRVDFHGAYLIVCASKNPSIIGLKGYLVQESKNTFRLLSPDNRLLTIPKNETVFAFKHNEKLYKINGFNIMMSSFNRSKIKPKFKYICHL